MGKQSTPAHYTAPHHTPTSPLVERATTGRTASRRISAPSQSPSTASQDCRRVSQGVAALLPTLASASPALRSGKRRLANGKRSPPPTKSRGLPKPASGDPFRCARAPCPWPPPGRPRWSAYARAGQAVGVSRLPKRPSHLPKRRGRVPPSRPPITRKKTARRRPSRSLPPLPVPPPARYGPPAATFPAPIGCCYSSAQRRLISPHLLPRPDRCGAKGLATPPSVGRVKGRGPTSSFRPRAQGGWAGLTLTVSDGTRSPTLPSVATWSALYTAASAPRLARRGVCTDGLSRRGGTSMEMLNSSRGTPPSRALMP